jgi:hypothetical protein
MQRKRRQVDVPDIKRFPDSDNSELEPHYKDRQPAKNRRDHNPEPVESKCKQHLNESREECHSKHERHAADSSR